MLHEHPDFCGGPAYSPDLFQCGKLTRFCKGGDNSAAIKESKLARLEARKTAATQLKMMQEQAAAMAAVEMPAYEAPPPPPTPGLSGADDAALQQRRDAKRRFGVANTVRGGAKMAFRSTMGGAAAA